MRLLVACDHCHRQYDASALAAGSRFHCRCGATVGVPRTEPREAAVVRCSSCGGARDRGAPACRYCGADYTLHEQDMETICPACMARVSNRAKYCHNCATAIVPEEAAGETTDHACPSCGDAKRLVSRSLGSESVSVLECATCAGLWLGRDTFEIVLEKTRKTVAAEGTPAPARRAARSRAAAGPLYRKCPLCDRHMNRVNYGRKSGVIVDNCKSHGLWFDADELEGILRWIRSGGEGRAERARQDEARMAESHKMFQSRWEKMTPASGYELDDTGSDAIGMLLAGLFDL